MDAIGRFLLTRPAVMATLVALALLGLPLAVWLDLRALSDDLMRRQADSLAGVISTVRAYYAENVVGRVLASEAATVPRHDFRDVDGAIPIPATLSIELGEAIRAMDGDVQYRFASDLPFANRPPAALDAFQADSLAYFRTDGAEPLRVEYGGTLLDRRITIATPVVMGEACVACHNAHPESPRHDWEVGDVRGLQTISVHQPLVANIWSFKWLLGYLALAGTFGTLVAALQFRLAGSFARLNADLEANNSFLAGISMKISKYLPPQVYRSIFAGERDAAISTERKKLTVFFSDIQNFTDTAERLQPEELTRLLNEYFSEMSRIAETHGATIDKFIGDAMVAFFGDPETRGTAEDARACVRMAMEMQRRLAELESEWRHRGIEHPFKARMGINTGYVNVGNFGSDDRMDYTIIGAEANLAARLQHCAQPGGIVLSYETYAHVADLVEARPLAPLTLKGIAREVVPYEVAMPDWRELNGAVGTGRLEEMADGFRVEVDFGALDDRGRAAARAVLLRALQGL